MTAESSLMQKLLDRIVQSPQHLIALETRNVEEMLTHMRMLALRSGTAVYAWEPEGGIVSLRESGLGVPGSKRFSDALRYVLQSMHFGIYLFIAFADHMKSADVVALRRITRMPEASRRKLVFVDGRFEIPEELEGLFERIDADDAAKPAVRLRDGRWIQ